MSVLQNQHLSMSILQNKLILQNRHSSCLCCQIDYLTNLTEHIQLSRFDKNDAILYFSLDFLWNSHTILTFCHCCAIYTNRVIYSTIYRTLIVSLHSIDDI